MDAARAPPGIGISISVGVGVGVGIGIGIGIGIGPAFHSEVAQSELPFQCRSMRRGWQRGRQSDVIQITSAPRALAHPARTFMSLISVQSGSHTDAHPATPARNRRVAWIAVTAWLMAMVGVLWYFGLKERRPFEVTKLSFFDSQARAQSAEAWYRAHVFAAPSGGVLKATVVSFMRPDCPCNRFTEEHLRRITARYQKDGVRFVSLNPAAGPPWVDAAPAALIYDANGRLSYFGPYSAGAWCGVSGGFVETVLDKLLKREPVPLQPFYGSGCFCGSRQNL